MVVVRLPVAMTSTATRATDSRGEEVVCDQIAPLVEMADTHRISTSHYRHAKAPFTKANNNKKARPGVGQAENEKGGAGVLG